MILRLSSEQEKSLRDTLIHDRVYQMVHDTLRGMRPDKTDLTQVQIWMAAAEFTLRLLDLPDAEELLPDEVADLRNEVKGENDATLIMTTSICQLAALHKKTAEADDIISHLLPFCVGQPIYRQLIECFDGKEQKMIAKGKGIDFDKYEMTEVEATDDADESVKRLFDNIIANIENMSPAVAEANLLSLCLINLQQGNRFARQLSDGFEKLKHKVNVRPLVNVEGDYVMKKNVEMEIGNIADGGVGAIKK